MREPGRRWLEFNSEILLKHSTKSLFSGFTIMTNQVAKLLYSLHSLQFIWQLFMPISWAVFIVLFLQQEKPCENEIYCIVLSVAVEGNRWI